MPTRNEVLKEALAKGFRVTPSGFLITPDRKPRSIHIYQKYPSFNMRHGGTSFHVHLHRLAAICKYGAVMFEENILIRHRDNNKNNYKWKNLALGTAVHNWDDNPDHIKEKCIANLKYTKGTPCHSTK